MDEPGCYKRAMPNEPDPFARFGAWIAEAEASEPSEPNAMTLATATPDGRPSARAVLLKSWDDSGFVFYTNLRSRKGRELQANAEVALLFHWKSKARQVRIEGPARLVPDAEADAYFASRPRPSRIGAWASRQSDPMGGRLEFEARIARTMARYPVGPVPRPDFWSGYRVAPRAMEFWEAGDFRLHFRGRDRGRNRRQPQGARQGGCC